MRSDAGSDLAVLACGGALPVQIAEAFPEASCFGLKGVENSLGARAQEHRIEKLGALFDAMRAAGCRRMVLAGSLARPKLNPTEMDATTLALAPRLMAAMQQGDDFLLRQVIEVFEDQGFTVVGAHDLLPGITAQTGLSLGSLTDRHKQDAARGFDILSALSPLDVGQGCVVASGQCIGIETLQGTDALLTFVQQTQPNSGGVFVKAAKRGQDLRVDMPVIGPATVASVAAAGLAGIAVEAGRVMILDRDKTLDAIDKAGLFLAAQDM